MKKLMLMLGVVSALAISCTKEKPTVSFAKSTSVLMADAPLKVELTPSLKRRSQPSRSRSTSPAAR